MSERKRPMIATEAHDLGGNGLAVLGSASHVLYPLRAIVFAEHDDEGVVVEPSA